ncbi:MAG: hypothetical protein V4485_00695 [Pseudomonadota bacterium]
MPGIIEEQAEILDTLFNTKDGTWPPNSEDERSEFEGIIKAYLKECSEYSWTRIWHEEFGDTQMCLIGRCLESAFATHYQISSLSNYATAGTFFTALAGGVLDKFDHTLEYEWSKAGH